MTAAPDCVVHNGIDVQHFLRDPSATLREDVRRSVGFSSQDYVIGLCSALRPEKAHGDLLQAIARMRSKGVPAKALLIGDGPQRSRIERQSDELRIRDHVSITGMRSDVRPYIECCDVMTLVSHSETFSSAALEAMALGKAVVMSDVGGASEQILHGESGFLFAAADIEALVTCLTALASEPLRARMGCSAAQRVRQLFTLDRMIDGFSDRIEWLLGQHSPAIESRSLQRYRSCNSNRS
jgi:glycosyltransferase involved in cell wall biosynthesis